jgi:hypothetical protein
MSIDAASVCPLATWSKMRSCERVLAALSSDDYCVEPGR